MKNFDIYIKKLKEYGYNDNQNISDFWFANKNEIENKIFGSTGLGQTFSLLIRWHSEIGLLCEQEIRRYIVQIQQNKTNELNNQVRSMEIIAWKKFVYSPAIIDFDNFVFEFNNIKYNLNKFCAIFNSSTISGYQDLRGINLSGIQLNNCILRNSCISNGNFSNSNFQGVQLINMNLVSSNFTNARLVSIKFDKQSSISSANLTNSYLNAIEFTDRIIRGPIEIKQISYFSLLKKAVMKENLNSKRDHTEFMLVDTTEILNYELKSLKNYIEWYMTISKKINTSRDSFRKRISLIFQIIISKYWSSILIFGFVTIFTILILASFFYFSPSNFKIPCELKPVSYMDSVYFIVVTFTTLGYGDISPINLSGQLLVIATVFLGYFFLGIFVYLLSKKIGQN